MKNRPPLKILAALVVACALILPGGASVQTAHAEGATVLRFASLAPSNSSFGKVLKAWGRTLKKETAGRVDLRFYSGGSQGDERDFVRKMRAGQMDGAGITAVGLGIISRPVLVLAAPGLIHEYDELWAVRRKLNKRFEELFEDAGFKLLAWGDAGKTRIFSTQKFAKPSDIKSLRPWAWKDDPIFAEFLKVIGANAVRLGVPEVYPGLQTKMIDTVPASAIAAVALQWYTRLNYMAKDHFGILVGASIIKMDKFKSLSEADQKALIDTAERAARALDKLVIRDDAKSYKSMVARGMIEVDTSAHKAEWDAVDVKTQERLTGRIYSKALLDEVKAAAASK